MPFCKIIFVFVRGLIVSRAKLSLGTLKQQTLVSFSSVPAPIDSDESRWYPAS
jgi:hypothetical protein